jgi:hypothetical protein
MVLIVALRNICMSCHPTWMFFSWRRPGFQTSTATRSVKYLMIFLCFLSSSMESKPCASILTRRPFGGTAILVRRNISSRYHLISTENPHVTVVCYRCRDHQDLFICSVHMPWNDRSLAKIDEYVSNIGCLQGLLNSSLGCLFACGGDLILVKMFTMMCVHL